MEVDSPAIAANAHYHNPYQLQPLQPLQPLPESFQQQHGYYGYAAPTPKMRKRKAESQENERLSKRLSLLNLEKNGHRLYIPVESSSSSSESLPEHPGYSNPVQFPPPSTAVTVDDDNMHLDNTKHKVYIYDLDAELSSADENSENGSRPGSPTSGHDRVIFLPDIEKHLCRPQIPPVVLANSEGQLAGHDINDMQMVLYSEPSSLTVPREHDSVRKAILEARARARQRQADEQEAQSPSSTARVHSFGVDVVTDGFGGNATPWRDGLVVDEDVDAMDTD
ncbi:hypothetical protein CHU98_g10880 [Xylaria longipes]|nr:hypothetical protein CHU98_g10880 [Xylaria longipes]